jgi:shikimate dehydrogenase
MSTATDIAAIQACITNRLDDELGGKRIAGVIGAAPSRYSKSPALWNAAFAFCALDALYLPFDIAKPKLKDFVEVLRGAKSVMGVNVTVPHKLAIMDFLDELDPGAARIQAVNTVVRTTTGRLIGYNTDGEGFVDSLLKIQPGQAESFLASLSGADVILLGSGGSARAVAFYTSELLGGGKLIICNRTLDHARTLAAEIRKTGFNAYAIGEDDLAQWAPKAMLIINSTTKGQGGSLFLEPYSALAPALQSAEAPSGNPTRQLIQADIKRNNETSLALAAAIPQRTRFYDLIYFPEETIFLRHARETGHMTMNGKAMIVCQAAIAFSKRICRTELQARGMDDRETWARILEIMHKAW